MSAERGEIKIREILMSEDISRSMSNNRATFINLYTGVHIVRGVFPLFFQTGIGISFSVLKTGKVPIEVELGGDVIDRSSYVKAQLDVIHMPSELESQLFVCGVMQTMILRPGNLEIRVGVHGDPLNIERIYRIKHKPRSEIHGVTGESSVTSATTSFLDTPRK